MSTGRVFEVAGITLLVAGVWAVGYLVYASIYFQVIFFVGLLGASLYFQRKIWKDEDASVKDAEPREAFVSAEEANQVPSEKEVYNLDLWDSPSKHVH